MWIYQEEGLNLPSKKTSTFYPCVFDNSLECPVRVVYKLRPESLVEFCKICPRIKGKKDERN